MPTLALDDAVISYEKSGEKGPCLLLVQGAGAVGEGWRPQIDDLSVDHRLAWLDNRGIGRSVPLRGPVTISTMAADCLALLDHLGWESAHLVGHSMGGLIIQEAARRAPRRLRSLALLSTVYRGRDITRISFFTLLTQARMLFGNERSRWLRFSELAFPPQYRAEIGDDATLEILRATFCPDLIRWPRILFKQFRAMSCHLGGDMAPLQGLPTLIATGALDRVVATSYSDDLAARLPQARLERFADAGHGVPMQNRALVNRLLREHIRAAEALHPRLT